MSWVRGFVIGDTGCRWRCGGGSGGGGPRLFAIMSLVSDRRLTELMMMLALVRCTAVTFIRRKECVCLRSSLTSVRGCIGEFDCGLLEFRGRNGAIHHNYYYANVGER